MERTQDPLQIKRAWQTAFELRLCPDDEALEQRDQHVLRHLAICHVCRERLEMPESERTAWRELQRCVAAAQPACCSTPPPAQKQIWSLRQSLADWGKDGYFYRPPKVLLLDAVEKGRGFWVAQLYSDPVLMGAGDVWLDKGLGFAQGWNCYTIHRGALDRCWGEVGDEVHREVLRCAAAEAEPLDEESVLYFFRRMEINVGARVALPSVAVLVEELEAVTEAAAAPALMAGLLVRVTEVGETVISMAQSAVSSLWDALDFQGVAAMEPARSGAGAAAGAGPGSEAGATIEFLKANAVPFVPIKIYTADDCTYIELFRFAPESRSPRVSITCQGEAIDGNRVTLDSWDSDRPKLAVKDLWLPKSKLVEASRLFQVSLHGEIVVIDILPE